MPQAQTILSEDPFIVRLKSERRAGLDYQKRRHEQWNDNYTLDRDTVQINRLTQRQAVNIPLVKETKKTLLSSMDEEPDVYFKELGNDIEREYALNEFWHWDMDRICFSILDMQDKTNVLLYGRSFLKLNFYDDKFDAEIPDIYDVLVDPKTNPADIESARYIIHQNIFRPLRSILANEKYDKEAKRKLKNFLSEKEGLIVGQENKEALENRKERLERLGENDYSDIEKLLSGGDVIVSLTEHFTTDWDEKKEDFVRYVAIVAEDNVVLYKEPLKKCLGVDFWPFVSWAGEMDTIDFWSDGPIDSIRTINKILNAWFSQGVENRTYRNFGMRFFDATQKAFNPKSFTPEPWGFYPVPGDPNKILKEVTIQPLADSINEIDWLVKMGEKATATPASEKGATENRQITLGEVQLAMSKAQEIAKGMAKFYTKARKDFADKWLKINEAGKLESQKITLFKTSYKGNIFTKEVGPSDWKSKKGYTIKITSSAEKEQENLQNIRKLMVVKGNMPDNPVVQRILSKKMMELVDLSAEEIKEVIDYEKNKPPVMLNQVPMEKIKSLKQTLSGAMA